MKLKANVWGGKTAVLLDCCGGSDYYKNSGMDG